MNTTFNSQIAANISNAVKTQKEAAAATSSNMHVMSLDELAAVGGGARPKADNLPVRSW